MTARYFWAGSGASSLLDYEHRPLDFFSLFVADMGRFVRQICTKRCRDIWKIDPRLLFFLFNFQIAHRAVRTLV